MLKSQNRGKLRLHVGFSCFDYFSDIFHQVCKLNFERFGDYMCKLLCKRGYKRYMDFNHNRFVLLVKEWYKEKLMIDFYYNEQFLGYTTIEASWADLFSSDSSDTLIDELMQIDSKLKEHLNLFHSMELFEENLLFADEQFQLELYVTVPFGQKANLKVCRLSDSKAKKVLQKCSLDAWLYQEIYDSCTKYIDGLSALADNLLRLYERSSETL